MLYIYFIYTLILLIVSFLNKKSSPRGKGSFCLQRLVSSSLTAGSYIKLTLLFTNSVSSAPVNMPCDSKARSKACLAN